jgi:MFS family permease
MHRIRDTFKKDLLSTIFVGVFLATTSPFFGVIARRQFSASPFHLSIISSSAGIGQIFTFYWGYIVRSRKDKMKMVVIPGALARGVFLFTPLVSSITVFLLLILLYQVISYISTPAYVEVIKFMYPDIVRARLMGIVRMVNNLVVITVTPVAGHLISSIGFKWTFFLGAIFGIISSVIFSTIKIKQDYTAPNVSYIPIKSILAIPFLDRRFGSYLAIFFMYGLGNWLSNPIYPIVLVDKLQATSLQVGFISTISSGLSAISYIFWGRFIDRGNPVYVLALVFLLDFLIPLGYLLASIKPMYLFIVLSAVVSGIANAGIDLGVMNTILRIAPSTEIASYMALHSTFVGIRGILGPFLGATLYSFIGAIGVFSINITTAILGGVLMYRFYKNLTTI